MAGTISLGSFADNTVVFEMDYDDNMDLLTFRCRNDSDQGAFGLLTKTDRDGNHIAEVQYGLSAPAHQITTLALEQGKQGIRLFAGVKPGHFNGYAVDLRYPF